MTTEFNYTAEQIANMTPEQFAELQKQAKEAQLTEAQKEKKRQIEQAIESIQNEVKNAKIHKRIMQNAWNELAAAQKNSETHFELVRGVKTVGADNWRYRKLVDSGEYSAEELNSVLEHAEDVDDNKIFVHYKSWNKYRKTLEERRSAIDYDGTNRNGQNFRCFSLVDSMRGYGAKGLYKKAVEVSRYSEVSEKAYAAENDKFGRAIKELSDAYPNAMVTKDSYGVKYGRTYEERECVKVDFVNGSWIKLQIYEREGELHYSAQSKRDASTNNYNAKDWLNKFNNDNA